MLEPVHAMKALDLTLILSYWDLLYLFPFEQSYFQKYTTLEV